jgi:DNA modification methylase
VLDPFAGSGTIFPAANRAQVTAWGVEREESYYHLALSRMAETSNSDDILGDL